MDITPLIPKERRIITAYGSEGFVLGEDRYAGCIFITALTAAPLPYASAAELKADVLEKLMKDADAGFLLVGTGARFVQPDAERRRELLMKRLMVEWMDTGAACRTYNVLLSEERPVAALLLPL